MLKNFHAEETLSFMSFAFLPVFGRGQVVKISDYVVCERNGSNDFFQVIESHLTGPLLLFHLIFFN
jgi:hypothetical protein